MSVIIEKGIPIPKSRLRGEFRETLSQMEVGDSFVFAINKVQNVRDAAKRIRLKISIRTIDGGKQARVWLIDRAPKAE